MSKQDDEQRSELSMAVAAFRDGEAPLWEVLSAAYGMLTQPSAHYQGEKVYSRVEKALEPIFPACIRGLEDPDVVTRGLARTIVCRVVPRRLVIDAMVEGDLDLRCGLPIVRPSPPIHWWNFDGEIRIPDALIPICVKALRGPARRAALDVIKESTPPVWPIVRELFDLVSDEVEVLLEPESVLPKLTFSVLLRMIVRSRRWACRKPTLFGDVFEMLADALFSDERNRKRCAFYCLNAVFPELASWSRWRYPTDNEEEFKDVRGEAIASLGKAIDEAAKTLDNGELVAPAERDERHLMDHFRQFRSYDWDWEQPNLVFSFHGRRFMRPPLIQLEPVDCFANSFRIEEMLLPISPFLVEGDGLKTLAMFGVGRCGKDAVDAIPRIVSCWGNNEFLGERASRRAFDQITEANKSYWVGALRSLVYAGHGDSFEGRLRAQAAAHEIKGDEFHEVCQEAMVAILTNLDSFEFRSEGELAAWIRKMFQSACLRWVRARSRCRALGGEEARIPAPCDERHPMEELLKDMAKCMTSRQWHILTAHANGIKNLDLSASLGMSRNTVSADLERAKRLAREYLAAHGHGTMGEGR